MDTFVLHDWIRQHEKQINAIYDTIRSPEVDRAIDFIELFPNELQFFADYLHTLIRYYQWDDIADVQYYDLNVEEPQNEFNRFSYSIKILHNILLSIRDKKFYNALELLEKLEISLENHSVIDLSRIKLVYDQALIHKRFCYFLTGNIEKMHEITERINKHLDSFSPSKQFDELNSLGIVYEFSGDFNNALKYYKSAGVIAQKTLSNLSKEVLINFNISRIYRYRGKIAEANTHANRAMESAKISQRRRDKFLAMALLGSIRFAEGKYEESEKLLEDAYFLIDHKRNKMPLIPVWILTDLVELNLAKGEMSNAKKYQRLLSEYDFQSERLRIRKLYVEGLILKNGGRVVDKTEAMQKFHEVIKSTVREFQITLKSMFELSELLLFEFDVTENTDVLDTLHQLLDKLESFAKEYNADRALAQVYIIRAGLARVEGNFVGVTDNYSKAKNVASKSGLIGLHKFVETEENSFYSELEQLEKTYNVNRDMIDKFKTSKLLNYVKYAQEVVANSPFEE